RDCGSCRVPCPTPCGINNGFLVYTFSFLHNHRQTRLSRPQKPALWNRYHERLLRRQSWWTQPLSTLPGRRVAKERNGSIRQRGGVLLSGTFRNDVRSSAAKILNNILARVHVAFGRQNFPALLLVTRCNCRESTSRSWSMRKRTRAAARALLAAPT
ncbi:unnamed protein product, partial [Ectocarpus fasciculatus]